VVFAAIDAQDKLHVWLAALDRRSPPRQLADGDVPLFGPGGTIFFRVSDGRLNFIYRMKEDGSDLHQVVTEPIIFLLDVSPDGGWVLATAAAAEEERSVANFAYPTTGGSRVRICNQCGMKWSPDGKLFYIWIRAIAALSMAEGERRTYVLSLRPGMSLPPVPPSGFNSEADLAALPAARIIPRPDIHLGSTPSVYAYWKVTVHRNLYRIPVP
jgi:hypothetical protein